MPFIPLIIFLFVIFAVLIFFLRHILTNNITRATSHLEKLSQEYAAKQEEIARRLHDAKQESHEIITKAKQETEELRNQILKEANTFKEKIINDARQKSEDIIEQAEKTCESLKQEIHQHIEQKTLEKACELIQNALPDQFRRQLHALWMEEAAKLEFDLRKLKLPDQIQEIKLVSAFPLTEKEKQILHEKLSKRFGAGIKINREVDDGLVAGLVIAIDNIVVDGSLKDKIKKPIKQNF